MDFSIGELALLTGLPIRTIRVWHITDYWARQTCEWQTRKNASFIKTYVDRGCVGLKSCEGFYRYPHPAFADPGFAQGDA
jgi:3-hydroxyacyl-CoA dehydrogenase